jgi:hypothetical protein
MTKEYPGFELLSRLFLQAKDHCQENTAAYKDKMAVK